MRRGMAGVVWRLVTVLIGWHLLEGGCIGNLQREMEVLFAPGANPTLIRHSFLFRQLGPEFLKFWVDFW